MLLAYELGLLNSSTKRDFYYYYELEQTSQTYVEYFTRLFMGWAKEQLLRVAYAVYSEYYDISHHTFSTTSYLGIFGIQQNDLILS